MIIINNEYFVFPIFPYFPIFSHIYFFVTRLDVRRGRHKRLYPVFSFPLFCTHAHTHTRRLVIQGWLACDVTRLTRRPTLCGWEMGQTQGPIFIGPDRRTSETTSTVSQPQTDKTVVRKYVPTCEKSRV